MEALVAREGIQCIVPTHPVEVRTLASEQARFKDVRFLLPDYQSIETAQSKWATWQKLSGAGLPVPATYLIKTPTDLEVCFGEISERPLWVRGAGVPGVGIGVASLPCKNIDQASSWIDYWDGWGGFIASQFLPGRNLTWLGLFSKGQLIACQGRQRLEYVIPHVSPSGITGAPAVSKTVSRADIRDIGEAAVREITLRPNGPFFVDMTEDAAGKPKITEINGGRFGTTIHFYTEAGFNFPWMAVKLAFGEPIENTPIIDPIPPDTWWLRTLDCGPVLARGLDG
jgi:carbamoyl-phosphate synthase large subunit